MEDKVLGGTMKNRDDVIVKLKPFLTEHPKTLAVWEGGSAATNTLDAYSDLDILIVAEKHDTETLLNTIDAFFEKQFGVIESMRMPEPTWHGFAQKFYHLANTEPWLYVDLCVMPPTVDDGFTAPDRHGLGVVWKDTIDFIKPAPTPHEMIKQRAAAHYARATQGAFILRLEIEKAFRRKHYLDAYQFMHGFIMRHLVPLMNIEHRIAKVDFGIRYADRDYAPEDYQLLVRFFRASSLEALKGLSIELFNRFEALKAKHEGKRKKTSN